MQSLGRDPRTYVKQVPLPVYIPKGVKVQARSLQVFNPTIPSREDMRKANIRRRHSQMTSQGFRSVNFKPYHGIGDPFYLDQKQLILHALGQLDESGDASNRYGGERDDGIDLEEDAHIHRKSKSASKFVLRRDRKGLSCLNKEVVKGRTLVRNVKLGHGLFDLIKQQRHAKRAQLEAERRRKEEAARTDWQPPKMDNSDSDTDSSDDELGQDISLNSFMTEIDRQDTDDEGFDQSLGPGLDSPEGKGRVTFSGFGGEVSAQPDTLTVSSRAVSSRKKKTQELRPYTPQHNSLAECDELHSCSKEALFRQLCALYWILESMNMDQPALLGPVSQSWNLRQIGGKKIPAKHAHDKRLAETRWDQFVSKDFVPRGGKRVSTGRNRITPRRMTILPRHSILSIASTSSVATPNSPRNTSFVIPESSPAPSSQEVTSVGAGDVEEDTGKNSTIFKFLDEYYASLDKERENLDLAEDQGTGQEVSPTGQSDRRGTEIRLDGSSPRKSASAMGMHYDGKPGDFHPSSDHRNMSARSNTSSSQVLRPKSSPALMEFQASLPSNKLGELPKEMKEKFEEIKGDKAAELNYDLELLERNRLKSCQNKFVAMSVLASQGRGFHRTLEGMRTPTARKSQRALQQQRLRKKSSIHCTWFTDLLDSLPENLKKEWQFSKILHRLTKYGLKVLDSSIESQLDEHSVDGNGKQSVYKFLNILKNLRSWEICNPDVCAAIEFCRRNIVEMTVSEFEEWFLQTFPTIDRPQTAPPNLKNNRKGGKSASTISKG